MGESGDKERDGVVGLFHEGNAPTLICETRNGEWPSGKRLIQLLFMLRDYFGLSYSAAITGHSFVGL